MMHVGFHNVLGWLDHLRPAPCLPPSTPVRCGWRIGLDAVMGWKFLHPLPSAMSGWSGWTRQWGKYSSVHCRPLWVAEGVGRGNWVKILPSTGVRCELLSENRLVFNPYFSLFFSMFLYFSLFSLFFSIFLCPLKINLKIMFYFALFFSIFLWEPDGVSPR